MERKEKLPVVRELPPFVLLRNKRSNLSKAPTLAACTNGCTQESARDTTGLLSLLSLLLLQEAEGCGPETNRK